MHVRSIVVSLLFVANAVSAEPGAPTAIQAKSDWETLRCLADKDKNDKLSDEEARQINLLAPRILERNFASIDANHDGLVTLPEYTAYQEAQRAGWEAEFKAADADRSGGISKAELAKTRPNEFARIKRRFDAMDADKDGQVSMEERDRFNIAQVKEKETRPKEGKVATPRKAPAPAAAAAR